MSDLVHVMNADMLVLDDEGAGGDWENQTLACILIDQRNESFGHGQTYVAFGRACNRDSVRVLVRENRLHTCDGATHALIRNVTYPRLLA